MNDASRRRRQEFLIVTALLASLATVLLVTLGAISG